MRNYVSADRDHMMTDRVGTEEQMEVKLREVDPFNLWVGRCGLDHSCRAICRSPPYMRCLRCVPAVCDLLAQVLST